MNRSTSSFSQPVAVVTGSSSGIGRATALRLARDGFAVILHGRRGLAGLQETAQRIKRLGGASPKTVALTADISCPDSCRQLVEAAFAWQGRVDVWVNNAGADVLTGAAAGLDFEARLARLWAVDVAGTIRLSRLVASRMARGDGNDSVIINTGWDQASLGMEGDAGQLFCPTKGAIELFSRALALSVGPNVRVNCIAPGWIKTDWGETAPEQWDRRATSESLVGRWGSPEDVAACTAWLASSEARFINGQRIDVNGGRRFHTTHT